MVASGMGWGAEGLGSSSSKLVFWVFKKSKRRLFTFEDRVLVIGTSYLSLVGSFDTSLFRYGFEDSLSINEFADLGAFSTLFSFASSVSTFSVFTFSPSFFFSSSTSTSSSSLFSSSSFYFLEVRGCCSSIVFYRVSMSGLAVCGRELRTRKFVCVEVRFNYYGGGTTWSSSMTGFFFGSRYLLCTLERWLWSLSTFSPRACRISDSFTPSRSYTNRGSSLIIRGKT